MKRGMQWPIGIAAVLALSAGGQVWFAVVAGRDKAFAVEGDYYQKAIHWDDELAQRRDNAHLGWTVKPTLRLAAGNGDGALAIELRDASGAAILGATVEVLAMHNARANRPLSATLSEVGRGQYQAQLPAQRPGEWELRFTVQRGGERFTVRERVEAAGS
jgi:nitrogen fixation protein FixH